METVTTVPARRRPPGSRQHSGPLTRAELDALPEDGLRHELLDGAFVMTPSPGSAHQVIVPRLWSALDRVCPDTMRTMISPFDVHLPTGDLLVPDVLVARAEDIGPKDLVGVPVLVVEVLSPSTRHRDVGDKLRAYERAGVPHYWVVDPDGPHLLAHTLTDGTYERVGDVRGDAEYLTDDPFPLSVVPSRLLD